MKKYLVTIVFTILMLILNIPNFSHAAVEYTRTFTGSDGSITINLTGLELDESKSYSFALTKLGQKPTTWHDLVNYTTNTATVNLNSTIEDIVDVLKVTDIGLLYLKDNSNDNYLLDSFKVDLKLPYLNSIPYEYHEDSSYWHYYWIQPGLYDSIGDRFWGESKNTFYRVEKVRSKKLVQTWLDNDKSAVGIDDNLLPKFPSGGFTDDGRVKLNQWEDGLYIIWVKLTGTKEVHGAILHDGKPNATTVEEYLTAEDLKETEAGDGTTNPGDNNQNDDKKQDDNKNDGKDDKTNNKVVTPQASNKNSGNSGKNNADDSTTAKGILPKTGISMVIIFVMVLLVLYSIFVYKKYNTYKDVK